MVTETTVNRYFQLLSVPGCSHNAQTAYFECLRVDDRYKLLLINHAQKMLTFLGVTLSILYANLLAVLLGVISLTTCLTTLTYAPNKKASTLNCV